MKKIKIAIVLSLLTIMGLQAQKHVPYKTSEGETITSICKKFTITPNDLLRLNPAIKNGLEVGQLLIVPNKNFKPENDIEKGDYVEDGFLYHKVLPKENYTHYRRKYGASKKELRKHNLILRTPGEKVTIGTILKIPVSKRFKLPNTTTIEAFKPYLVLPKETKYMISRRYGISVEKLEELNPQIKDGLQADSIIQVPNTIAIPDEPSDYITYQIVKDDNYFNLGQRFDTTKERLIELNPELEEVGIQLNAVIKIDKQPTQLLGQFRPLSLENKEIKIGMLLPFESNKSVDFQKQRGPNAIADFYLGTLMALDSLKNQGLSIEVKLKDTHNNKQKVLELLNSGELDNVDLLIGPLYYDNVAVVSTRTTKPHISPLSTNPHSFATKGTIQASPLIALQAEKMLNYIKQNYTNQILTVIIDDKAENQANFQEIIRQLNELDTLKKVNVLKPKKGFIRSDYYKSRVKKGQQNWIVLITEDTSIAADAIQNLGVLPEEVEATFFTLYYHKYFDDADNNFLARLNFHFPKGAFIDEELVPTQNFINAYKRKYRLDPSEYSYKGFDVTYDALLRLTTRSKLQSAFTAGSSQRLSTRYHYKPIPGKGLVNEGMYIVKYDGLSLKLVE